MRHKRMIDVPDKLFSTAQNQLTEILVILGDDEKSLIAAHISTALDCMKIGEGSTARLNKPSQFRPV